MYKNRVTAIVIFLYACAALQSVRFYIQSTPSYLNASAYLAGHERLPFQERVFPILVLRPLANSTFMRTHLAHGTGPFTVQRGPFYLLSLVSVLIAAIYTQRLYDFVSTSGMLRALVFPIFLFAVMWTYAIHTEANFAYPYDLPSLAFFTAGLYYVYRRRFLPLLWIVLLGTFNRETTLFLIALFVIDSATVQPDTARDRNPGSFDLRLLPWLRIALLSAVWLSVKLLLAHRFAGNDASESFLRVHNNFHQLKPRLVPALLNVCGYTLPLVVLFHRFLQPRRFKNYLWILPLWFAVMFCFGVLVETRIYGELCSFSAVALVLILENYVARRVLPAAADSDKRRVARDLPRRTMLEVNRR